MSRNHNGLVEQPNQTEPPRSSRMARTAPPTQTTPAAAHTTHAESAPPRRGDLSDRPTDFGRWLIPYLMRAGFAQRNYRDEIKFAWTDFERAFAARFPSYHAAAQMVYRWIVGKTINPTAAPTLGMVADLLDIPRTAMYYHAGLFTLKDVAEWLGPMPPYTLSEQEYVEQVAGLQMLPDAQLRDLLVANLQRDLAWSRKVEALALSPHDFALLRERMNTEAEREQTRYALHTIPDAAPQTPAAQPTQPTPATRTAPSLPSEFSNGIQRLRS